MLMFYYLTMHDLSTFVILRLVRFTILLIHENRYQERHSSISLLKKTITQATRFRGFFSSAYVLGLIHL